MYLLNNIFTIQCIIYNLKMQILFLCFVAQWKCLYCIGLRLTTVCRMVFFFVAQEVSRSNTKYNSKESTRKMNF